MHEFSHALAARLLGDFTAQRAGRLTLNPIRHLDPFGTLLLVLTTVTGAPGMGWGKPVPVNGAALRYGRAGMAIVSGAGPFSNFVLATLTFVALNHLSIPPDYEDGVVTFAILNLGLCAFNLLPIPPLDGFGVAIGILPAPLAYPLARVARYGPMILLILVFSANIIRISLLSLLLRPVIRLLAQAASGLANLI
ncbi:MAG TPA: site-2 protease family protein [Chloroflexota bacterium]|nr:site-2 protease family protein [Chloroflexota bacterium]